MLVSEAQNVLSSFPRIRAYIPGSSLLSFNFDKLPSGLVSYELDKMGICTRSGLHCAPSAHKKLGTLDGGCVRLSFSYFNEQSEINKLYKALKFINKAY